MMVLPIELSIDHASWGAAQPADAALAVKCAVLPEATLIDDGVMLTVQTFGRTEVVAGAVVEIVVSAGAVELELLCTVELELLCMIEVEAPPPPPPPPPPGADVAVLVVAALDVEELDVTVLMLRSFTSTTPSFPVTVTVFPSGVEQYGLFPS